MLKQGTFINKRTNRVFFGCVWGSLAYAINLMTDSLISGNTLGELSLQAVSIVYPLFSVAYIFAYLIAPGASIIYGKLIGEFKEKEAYRVSGTCLVSSVILAMLFSSVLWFLKTPFLTYFGCTGELLIEASNYYNWLIPFSFILVINEMFYYLNAVDGESVLISIANILDISINVVLSIILSSQYGISGLGMATFIGVSCRMLTYTLHFLRKSNNIKFHLCLKVSYVIESIKLSFSFYMYYVFLAFVDISLNKIIIMTCGLEYIPAYSVINLVFGTCEVNEAIFTSTVALVTCFNGERNSHDMQLVIKKIERMLLIMSLVLWTIFFFGAPLVPKLYGLETPATIDAAISASRIMSFTTLGFGICYLLNEISFAIEKPIQACFSSLLNDAAMPLLCSLALGSLWGFTGISIGMCLSPYAAFGIYSLVMILIKGKKGFPLYFDVEDEKGISYDLYVTEESIPLIRDWVTSQLTSHGYNIKNIEILIEELYMRMLEKNPGKRVLSECTLIFGENRARIIVRDNGTLFNFIDENNPVESLNAYVLSSMLEKIKEKNYVITSSFNRNGFVFENIVEK